MKITVINGTEQKGCTFAMKELFLTAMGTGHAISEYDLPRDCPVFCTGCKLCFSHDISICPHTQYTSPIWESILSADLLVFTSPTYVFHATGQMKAMLDHFGTKWMAHSPEKPMFRKPAVIITNAIGLGMGKAAKDIKDSLDFWGTARVFTIKKALSQGDWALVSDKKKTAIEAKCKTIAAKINQAERFSPRLKVKLLFSILNMMHRLIDVSERKAGRKQTRDYLYWKENGWLDGKKPWKD